MSNVLLNAGSGGATLGTDQVAGSPNVDYQIVKLGYSASGSAPTQVDGTHGLPANLIALAGTAPDTNSGNKSAGTLRVVIATDQPSMSNSQPASQSGTWNITNISGTVSLPTGAATAAKQPALGTAGSASADVLTIQGIASMTKLLVTPDSVALPANQSVNVSQINAVTPLMGNGVTGTGSLRVTISSDNTAFTVNAAQSGTWTVQPGNTANTTPWLTTNVPGTSPGTTPSRVKAAGSTNATSLKASAGAVFGYALYNNTSSAKYFKFYNKASAPTVGSDTPLFDVIIPASGGANIEWSTGIPFSTGIAYAITNAVGDSDTTAVSADDVHGLVLWK